MKSRILAAIAVCALLVPAAAFAGGRGGNSNASYMNQDSLGGPKLFAPWPGYSGSPSSDSAAARKAEAGAVGGTPTPAGVSASTPEAAPTPPAPATQSEAGK